MGAEEPVKKVKVDGVEIVYLDEGKGPCALLGHCSSASHKEWLPLIEELKGDWRVLAPDFIGYGQSDPWPIDKTFSIEADVKVLLALAKKTRAKKRSSASGRRDSNPRPSPWQGDALPLSHVRVPKKP